MKLRKGRVGRSKRRVVAPSMIAAASVAGVVPVVGSAEMASAHPASTFFPFTWPGANVVLHAQPTFPQNMRDGMEVSIPAWPWNNGQDRPNVLVGTTTTNSWSRDCTTYQGSGTNRLALQNLDGAGNTVAETCRDVTGTTINHGQITFDAAENWYVGIGSPAVNQRDFKSVAVHELGHLLGWVGHWASPGGLCGGGSPAVPIHTMCPTYGAGVTYFRSPEEHDLHTLADAYP